MRRRETQLLHQTHPNSEELFALRHSPCCLFCTGDILIVPCSNNMPGTMLRDGITRLFCGHPPAGVAQAEAEQRQEGITPGYV